ncbi:hypothetical protein CHLNCDRAFT_144174 [Chlorella variabilis]|uniref:Uncharacterized protein n=1 Tax=Chlorella variabilis TaxID=554065 RepID=E1ZC30_CHLVA|nr:hypothetical protein CHLNCDRAFT_144174 [Chlorella variabilis]EFN56535.1 hypothetical protein CHLNCDRAFT_144174 [Chlorella variabilis]|eukprot:XP_005848637.1 hypothetical protein CHLNCDRAFT_144174 [Chlorella variabilis]
MASTRVPQRRAAPTCSPFDALPDALLGRILALSVTGKDMEDIAQLNLALVSKRWCRVYFSDQEVDSWWGPCSAYEHASLDGTKLAATVASRLPDFLARFHPQRLRDLRLSGYRLSEEAAKVLHRFTGLKRLHVYGAGAGSLPPSCAWMVGQLTALTCLDLMAAEIPADLPAAAAHLPSLAALELSSGAPLPGCRPLSALTNLTCLGLFEEESSESGLQLPAMPCGNLCYFQQAAGQYHVSILPERQARGRGDVAVTLVSADLDRQTFLWNEEEEVATAEGSGTMLAALLRAVLPAGAALVRLSLIDCFVKEAGFSSPACGPLLASVTSLEFTFRLVHAVWDDEALQRALGAVVALTPGLRALDIWGADGEPGKQLACGLPPAVTALRQLEELSTRRCLLPSLPPGPYLAGLTKLWLSGSRLEGPLPAALAAATRLQTLGLGGNPGLRLDQASVDMLARLPHLQAITLDDCRPGMGWANEGFLGLSLGDLVRGEMRWCLYCSMALHARWLLSACPDLRPLVTWRTKTRKALREASGAAAEGRRFVLHTPPVPDRWGRHHSKMMLIEYATGVRFILPTPNLQFHQLHSQTQAVFFQDFPPKQDGTSPPGSDFETSLARYLAALQLPGEEAKHAQAGWHWPELVRRHDFSAARAVLVASVPGSHGGELAAAYGHKRLAALLGREA